MNAKLKRTVVVNAGWFLGLGLALFASIGTSFSRLGAQKARLGELRESVERKQESLRGAALAAGTRDQADMQARLSDWRTMVADESRMLAELSRAAHRAGVTLVDIRCRAQELSANGLIVSVTHELAALGSYRELGRFLSGLYRCNGAVGIDQLEIAREADTPASELRASVRVTWYADGPGKPAEDPAVVEG